MQDDSLKILLTEFMRANHLSQKDVADAAKVSQPSVSRALTRGFLRQGKAAARLFIYMQQQKTGGVENAGTKTVIQAFESVWDGSVDHANAIANIIKASEGLVPVKNNDKPNA